MAFVTTKKKMVFVSCLGITCKVTVQCGSETYKNTSIKNFDGLDKIISKLSDTELETIIPEEIPLSLEGFAYWIFDQVGPECLAVCVEDTANGNEATFIFEPEE